MKPKKLPLLPFELITKTFVKKVTDSKPKDLQIKFEEMPCPKCGGIVQYKKFGPRAARGRCLTVNCDFAFMS